VAARASVAPRSAPTAVGIGLVVTYLSLLVLLPLAAVVAKSQSAGLAGFWRAVTAPQPLAAMRFTVVVAALVAAGNVVMGTVVAWVLVRDDFRGKALVDTVIDLPFALPTVVAGLVLLTLYGPGGPVHVNIAYSRTAVVLALLFVTLPFVVRTVQPVLAELDLEMEAAAASLGASRAHIVRRIVLPHLAPALLTGGGLAFARSIGEFGSVSLLSGNLPFRTEVSSVNIYNQVQSDNVTSAAAQSTVLLAVAFIVLIALGAARRRLSAHG
jgi:sulfate/thiosulfate transport system permease protein